jgi:hypothetical protein
MSRRTKLIATIILVVVLLVIAFFAWERVLAPMIAERAANQALMPIPTPVETPQPSPVQTPTPAPTQTPNPAPPATTGTLIGHADTKTLHINKILVYNAGGQTLVTSQNIDSSGNFSFTLAPADYMIDYAASPDLYPHSKEKFTIIAGQTHEVDYMIEN